MFSKNLTNEQYLYSDLYNLLKQPNLNKNKYYVSKIS